MKQIGEEKEEKKRKRRKKRRGKKRRGKGERKRKKKGSKRGAEARNQNVPSAQSSISSRAQHIGIMPAREILVLLLLLKINATELDLMYGRCICILLSKILF